MFKKPKVCRPSEPITRREAYPVLGSTPRPVALTPDGIASAARELAQNSSAVQLPPVARAPVQPSPAVQPARIIKAPSTKSILARISFLLSQN